MIVIVGVDQWIDRVDGAGWRDGVFGELGEQQVQKEEPVESVIKPEELIFVVEGAEGCVGADVDRDGVATVLCLDSKERVRADQGAVREGESLGRDRCLEAMRWEALRRPRVAS